MVTGGITRSGLPVCTGWVSLVFFNRGQMITRVVIADLQTVSTLSQHDAVPSVSAIDPCPSHSAPEPVRDDPPLQQKVGLLVTLACAAGLAIGVYAERFGDVFWRISGCAILVLILLWWVGQWWVIQPYRKLAEQAERVSRTGLTSALRCLPVGRRDELGRIAKALHTMGVSITRNHMETLSLRRTLDQRVVNATRRATTELSRMVMRDALTDLGNRRFLDEHLGQLFDSAKESGTDLACVMMDLDKFKQVNDTLGHEAGDHLLVFLGGLIRATSRHDDLAVRLGGDEFVLIMPGSNRDRAEKAGQLIRKLFTRQAYTMFPNSRMLDVSFGVATLRADKPEDASNLMRMADKKLYDMKRSDR